MMIDEDDFLNISLLFFCLSTFLSYIKFKLLNECYCYEIIIFTLSCHQDSITLKAKIY